jgi:adenylate cyclase
VSTFNPAAAALLGLRLEEGRGLSYRDALNGSFNPGLIQGLERTRATWSPLIDQVEFVNLIGDTCTLDVRASALRGEGGADLGVVIVAEDVTTELKRKQALYRCMPHHVVEELMADPDQLAVAGERTEVTALFADLRGFTSLTVRTPVEEVVTLLNRFLTLATETIFELEGILDKFIGDAVMAVFGVPQPRPDDALRAVRAALRLQEKVAALSAERAAQGLSPIGLGIGLSTGEAIVGHFGSVQRLEYTAIGEEVNVAARLEEVAPAGTILISPRTLEKVQDAVAVEPLGPRSLQGLAEPLPVYRVVGVK